MLKQNQDMIRFNRIMVRLNHEIGEGGDVAAFFLLLPGSSSAYQGF
jgi:hypothetical protein